MNTDSIREFFKNRGEIGDLFHVEQLREYVCQVKRNVLVWNGLLGAINGPLAEEAGGDIFPLQQGAVI